MQWPKRTSALPTSAAGFFVFKDYDLFRRVHDGNRGCGVRRSWMGLDNGKAAKEATRRLRLDSLGGIGLPVSGFGGWIILILSGMLRRRQLIGCLAGSEPEAGAQKGN